MLLMVVMHLVLLTPVVVVRLFHVAGARDHGRVVEVLGALRVRLPAAVRVRSVVVLPALLLLLLPHPLDDLP